MTRKKSPKEVAAKTADAELIEAICNVAEKYSECGS